MERTIGLRGVVATLVGFVVGAGIFLLPGELAATAGPAVVISYALASILVAFSCVIGAFVSGIVPVSGASFVYSTKMTSPLLGFLMIWAIIAGASMGVAFVAHGFAQYVGVLLPGSNKTLVAVMIVLFFGGINLLGAVASVKAQTLMVVTFVATVLVFSVVGIAQIDTDLLVPFTPNGYGPVLMAAVPAFFSFGGFLMIIDIGGEIKNPSRTIPLGLLISFLLIWLCYSAVSLTIVGSIPWQMLADIDAPVATVAGIIFPDWAIDIIPCAVLAAAATSINAMLLAYSRDVYVLSRVRIFPEILSTISKKHGEPSYAVALLTVTSVICVLMGAQLSEYATLVVVVLMLTQILLGIATLRLPKIMPSRLSKLEFRLSPFWRVFFSVGLIVFSSLFIIIGLQGNPKSAVLFGLFLLAGAFYYLLRKNYLKARGINMEDCVMEFIDEEIAQTQEQGMPPSDR
jgi:basic amino acid/polyamine antiporter, APA family